MYVFCGSLFVETRCVRMGSYIGLNIYDCYFEYQYLTGLKKTSEDIHLTSFSPFFSILY